MDTMHMDSLDTCRICLGSHTESEVYINFHENCDVLEKIEICGGIKIEISDDLPNKICEECFHALNISYDFRNLCQSNELKLRNIYIEQIEIKDESLSDCVILSATPDDAYTSELSNDSNTCDPVAVGVIDEEPVKSIGVGSVFPAPNRIGKKPKPAEIKICEFCGNTYKRSSQLILHMRRHAAVKPFSCEICKKMFTCQSEIKRHMRSHTGVKPFKCKYCERKFSDSSTKIKHERTHTNERPFVCPTCGRAFTYSCVLKNHMLTHTGEKSFRCDVCNQTFSRAHQLKQHLLTIIHQQREAKRNLSTNEQEISNDIDTIN